MIICLNEIQCLRKFTQEFQVTDSKKATFLLSFALFSFYNSSRYLQIKYVMSSGQILVTFSFLRTLNKLPHIFSRIWWLIAYTNIVFGRNMLLLSRKTKKKSKAHLFLSVFLVDNSFLKFWMTQFANGP